MSGEASESQVADESAGVEGGVSVENTNEDMGEGAEEEIPQAIDPEVPAEPRAVENVD